MIVVADTTPLNDLILVGSVHVLPALFVRVHVPTAVIARGDTGLDPDAYPADVWGGE